MDRLCHFFNPLHVYCRLRDLGMGKKRAMKWGRRVEKVTKVVLYKCHQPSR